MAAPVIYNDVAEGANLEGHLFAGKKFWVAQRIPTRARFLELIRSNGGEVVMLEKKADYMIADHFRRDCPPGTISYTFIDKSLNNGAIEDLENHLAGPPIGTARAVGSISRPTKGLKTPYTAEEDRILYKWVRDHEKQGGSASGNELYKQLEALHPRHTWQSWRDHYLKQLKNRPPAGLTVPENAPPSPPSDQSAEKMPPTEPARNLARKNGQPVPLQRQSGSETRPAVATRNVESYTVDAFDTLFNKEEWEELYANVPIILGSSAADYMKAWEGWAQSTSQTAEQWRQYFEKVVRPQWDKDPESKKTIIQKRVKQRHLASQASQDDDGIKIEEDEGNNTPEVVEAAGPSTPRRKREEKGAQSEELSDFTRLVDKLIKERKGRKHQEAYLFWARDKNSEKKLSIWEDHPELSRADVHKALMPRWRALSDEEKAPYILMEAADIKRVEMEEGLVPSSERQSSTVAQDTPQYIARTHDAIMKRIRDGYHDEFTKGDELLPRNKRRKRTPSLEQDVRQVDTLGTQNQPLEISSAEPSSTSQEFEDEDEDGTELLQPQDVHMEDAIQAQLQTQEVDEEDDLDELDEPDQPTPTTEPPDMQYPELPSDSPSITPTPRAQRHAPSAFDTQAILSSPSQEYPISALPPPQLQTHSRSHSPSVQASPLAGKQESIASTTHSIQEFRRSLNDTDSPSNQAQAFGPIPYPTRSSSLAGSEAESQNSGDPDPPLVPEEIDEFFQEQYQQGFSDEEITAALRHTRCRPELAVSVLDAWKEGKGVPDVRGVWSIEDDEDVESGDGVALARLERKHSLDGWGGITERLRFLETWRSKEHA